MKSKKKFGLNVGASSILVIIVVLCLVCFSGLSITSANADLRLSQKLAERTNSYYKACNEAQIQLKKLTADLASIYNESSSEEEYKNNVNKSLSDSLSFYCSINENQVLQVSISPLYPQNPSGDFYEITYWQIVNLTSFELNDTLPVFQGN